MLVHRLEQPFAERAQVRAAVAGVLAVDERIKRLAVTAVAVREAEFQRLAGVMQRRINRLAAVGGQVLHDQVHQAVARLERLAVVNQLQPRVEVAVMAQPAFDVFVAELGFLENLRVGLELDEGAVRFLGLARILLLELAHLE